MFRYKEKARKDLFPLSKTFFIFVMATYWCTVRAVTFTFTFDNLYIHVIYLCFGISIYI